MNRTGITFGSLFAGIGGLDLGLQRAGMECIWQVEKDEYCRRVLAKHWPNVRRYEDVRDISVQVLDRPSVICGGFPCQDISHAGRRAGLQGEHSGLWAHFSRVVSELGCRYVLVENTTGLLVRGLGTILGDLADLGYDAEWHVIPAAAVGAPHLRARVFVLAYPRRKWNGSSADSLLAGWSGTQHGHRWPSTPRVCGADDGVPARVDRLRALGNAVVPQVAEWIGRRIVKDAR